MRIILAETAGFCWGVQRALDIALDTSRSNGTRVYTYGPLIHNNQVVAELEKRHILTLKGEPEDARDGKLVVREER
ncbi:MAG: 4-hydroxy-3-methylbut-2-enyl diphosphate reductase, partial [Spirochaetia bacterium]|nr:4-hydroxy-3-methylbut-2-enyl diphosphate reductase [Spirochaetia bacterium]